MSFLDLVGSGTFSFGTFVEALRVNDLLPSWPLDIDVELVDLDRTIDAMTVVKMNERKNAKPMAVLEEESRLDVCFEGLV